jgi:perosamine synthetase
MDCLESTWISSTGKYIEKFEAAFAEFCGARYAVSCSNGTTALHLALMALGVGPGDEVIVPTLTFVATANAVTYCGARPVFVDSDPKIWNINPDLIESKISARTRGIIAVHLCGHPADMDAIKDVADRHGLFVLEDAAQAHGAEYRGRKVGSLGDLATFSFFGNKIITTGEGGMVVTDDRAMADKMRLLRSHGMDPKQRYWHPVIGYNYRMTNVAAAIGLAQVERVEWQIERRREIAGWYRERLRDLPGLGWQPEAEWAKPVWWLFTIMLKDDAPASRDEIMAHLGQRGIETRPIIHPLHTLPPYADSTLGENFPIAERLARRGINLPTWAGLAQTDIARVCDALTECFSTAGVAHRP